MKKKRLMTIILGLMIFIVPMILDANVQATDCIDVDIQQTINDEHTLVDIVINAKAHDGYEITRIHAGGGVEESYKPSFTKSVYENGEYTIIVYYQNIIEETADIHLQKEQSQSFTVVVDGIDNSQKETRNYTQNVLTTSTDIAINDQTFPDSQFRAYITSTSYGRDNILTSSEINAVTSMSIPTNQNIQSLQGIEYFTELQYLYCAYQKLETLDLTHNKNLISLECFENNLSTLDIQQNLKLRVLYVSGNPNLSHLNLNSHTELTDLYIERCQFSDIDISNNTKLTLFRCAKNKITSLDLSQNVLLTDLECANNQLTSLDVSMCTNLETLYCNDNLLTRLEFGNISSLDTLLCHKNQLSTLDVSNNINMTQFWCAYNKLPYVDLSKLTQLKNPYLSYQFPEYVYMDKTDTYDLQSLDSRLNASNIKNASSSPQTAILEGTVVRNISFGYYFYYTVDCGRGETMQVGLVFNGINDWKVPLSIENSKAGDDNYAVNAVSYFGNDTLEYLYSDTKDGVYQLSKPTTVGTWYVKAIVAQDRFYTGLESEPLRFTINDWTESFTFSSWTYGETAPQPQIKAAFGNENIQYVYSQTIDGKYNHVKPVNAGTYYVKAILSETSTYKGLETQPVAFEITKAKNQWVDQPKELEWTLGSQRLLHIDSAFGQETAH